MSVVLRETARTELARSMFRDIQNVYDYYYFGFGKVSEWADEENPETPIDNDSYMADFRRNMLFVKRVNTTDVCLLARRIDWVSGTTYDVYDNAYSSDNTAFSGANNLASANFYVMTTNLNVYKCLNNNNNSPSTVEPTSTGTTPFDLGDGYTWQFMFQVQAADETKFLDSEYIPVRKVTGDPAFDVNGELDAITIDTSGSDYTEVPSVTIVGDGTGATATATISGGSVDSVTITNSGSGYSFAIISFSGGQASPSDPVPTQATATATLGSLDTAPALQSAVEATAASTLGTVDRIVMTNTGQDYVTGDVTVNIRGDGTGATGSAIVNVLNGAITGVTITNRGTGYTFAEVTFDQLTGPGTNAVARAVVSPPHGHGGHAPRELFAKNLAVVSSVNGDEDPDFMLENDFRQIALIKNLVDPSEAMFTSASGQSCYIANVSSSDAALLSPDDVLTTDANGRFVVSYVDDNNNVFLVPLVPLISVSNVLITNDATEISINTLTTPEIDSGSGRIIYLENRTNIVRSEEQVETVKAIFNF